MSLWSRGVTQSTCPIAGKIPGRDLTNSPDRMQHRDPRPDLLTPAHVVLQLATQPPHLIAQCYGLRSDQPPPPSTCSVASCNLTCPSARSLVCHDPTRSPDRTQHRNLQLDRLYRTPSVSTLSPRCLATPFMCFMSSGMYLPARLSLFRLPLLLCYSPGARVPVSYSWTPLLD